MDLNSLFFPELEEKELSAPFFTQPQGLAGGRSKVWGEAERAGSEAKGGLAHCTLLAQLPSLLLRPVQLNLVSSFHT